MLPIREELLHPMFLHFPIALFVLALLLKFSQLICPKQFKNTIIYISISNKVILTLAALTYLISIFLGDIALDAIKKNFCDLSAIYNHEQVAQNALYFFIGALLFEGVSSIEQIKKSKFYLTTINLIVLTFLFAGNYTMVDAAHLGAQLVYEKGAAVKNSSNSCD